MTTEKYKILAKYIKDMSSETPDIETFLFVKDNISKYQLNIDITSKALKNKMIEIHTTLKFQDINNNDKKSFFEIIYATVIKKLPYYSNFKSTDEKKYAQTSFRVASNIDFDQQIKEDALFSFAKISYELSGIKKYISSVRLGNFTLLPSLSDILTLKNI